MKVLSLVILIMFFGAIAGGTILESSALMKNFNRSCSDFVEREKMKELLDSIVSSFETLVDVGIDYQENPVLESICIKYAAYNLTIEDISSGCNLNFLPDADLSDPAMAGFLFAGGNAEEFLRFRRYRGFITEISEIQNFVKEESLNAVVCNGWFSALHVDSETGRMLIASYGQSGEELYPLVNDFPLINVNTADASLFVPLISRRSWRIGDAAAKATALKNRLQSGPVTEGELRSLLGLAENHEIYKYLGVRTSFWKLSFKNGFYRMNAVIAAIPERRSKTILYYSLIEGRLSRES